MSEWQPISREEFEATVVCNANRVARRFGQRDLSLQEIENMYRKYIKGKGSLLADPEESK